MMMCNSPKLIGLLLLTGLLAMGCKKESEQFILSSDEEGVICSAKSSFNDTIFYENRFPDVTVYYYATLSHQQNEELRKLIQNLKVEKSLPKFELRPDSGTFIVASDEVKFYEANYSIPSPNIKKILTLFRVKAPDMKNCKKIANFWNIDGVTPPDNPVP